MKIINLCVLLLSIPALSYAFGFGGGGGGRGIQIGTAGNYGLSMADNGASSFTCGDSIGHLFWESGVLKFCDPGSTTKTLAGGGGSLPSQTGNSGKYLTTNGTVASWGTIAAGGGITISTDIPTEEGVANLNDTTHVLTVASSTGYTQFTGSYTAWDTAPEAFAFTDETDIALSTAKTSNAITVAGTNYPAAISVTGDTGYGYSKNSAACTTTNGTVIAGDTVSACVTSSGSNSTATTATVTIGGVADTYSVTTVAGGSTLVSDDLNGASAPAGWTAVSGTPFGHTPAMSGYSYSAYVSSTSSFRTSSFAGAGEVYVIAKISTTNLGSNSARIIGLQDGANNNIAWATWNSQGKLQVSDGAIVTATTASVVINTPMWVKFYYKKGTGTDGVLTAWDSATGQAGTWTQRITKTTSTATSNVVTGYSIGDSGGNVLINGYKISSSDINNP